MVVGFVVGIEVAGWRVIFVDDENVTSGDLVQECGSVDEAEFVDVVTL